MNYAWKNDWFEKAEKIFFSTGKKKNLKSPCQHLALVQIFNWNIRIRNSVSPKYVFEKYIIELINNRDIFKMDWAVLWNFNKI